MTGELAIDPALYELVMSSGALMDRMLCGRSSPIPEEPPVRRPGNPPGVRGPGPGGGEDGIGHRRT
jgi:hypothetical protein